MAGLYSGSSAQVATGYMSMTPPMTYDDSMNLGMLGFQSGMTSEFDFLHQSGSPWLPHCSPPQAVFYELPLQPSLFEVPQRPYQACMQRGRLPRLGSVEFRVNGNRGIRLLDIQAKNFMGLENADDRLLSDFGQKVTYRIEWPGYGPFSRQKHALRATRDKESITRAKMAVHVAEVLRDFIDEMTPLPTSDLAWRVGPGCIEFQDIYLLGIRQVAKASLQPIIALRRNPQQFPTMYPC